MAFMTTYSMSRRCGPIANLTTELEIRCRAGRDQGTLEWLRVEGIDLTAGMALIDLAEACHSSTDRRRTEEILWLLVAQGVIDETTAIALLVALRPALLVLTRRLVAIGMGPFDAQTMVVSTAYERMFDVFYDRSTHVARAMVGGTWDRMRSALRAEQRCALRHVRLEDVGDVSEDDPGEPTGPTELTQRLSPLLRDAVAARVVSPETACVIHATRVEGRSFESIAHQLGKGAPAVRKARQRGERALIDCGHRRRQSLGQGPGRSNQDDR
jgi:hypothetical protein